MKYFLPLLLCLCACGPNQYNQESVPTTATPATPETSAPMYPTLKTYIASIQQDSAAIADVRKEQLKKIAAYIRAKKAVGQTASLTFICTHNSRRSHLSQVWAATAAESFQLTQFVATFSGGTEATAFNPRAVAALERAGFYIENPGGTNPHYQLRYSGTAAPMECFSKTYDDPFVNPQKDFAAIMTCTDADKNCPLVAGAEFRQSLPYEDPKLADNTAEETSRYDERCRQIATEMFYLMSQV